MKNIATIKSRRGHQEVDYLIKVSPKEFKMLQQIVKLYRHIYKDGSRPYTNITQLKKSFREFKPF